MSLLESVTEGAAGTVLSGPSLVVRLALVALLGVCASAAGAVLWHHYSSLVDEKASLSAKAEGLGRDLATATARADSFRESIDKWQEASRLQANAIEALTAVQLKAGENQKRLEDVLSKHDLTALARAKPQMVERRINAGTADTLRMLERATQAPGAAAGVSTPAAESSTARSATSSAGDRPLEGGPRP